MPARLPRKAALGRLVENLRDPPGRHPQQRRLVADRPPGSRQCRHDAVNLRINLPLPLHQTPPLLRHHQGCSHIIRIRRQVPHDVQLIFCPLGKVLSQGDSLTDRPIKSSKRRRPRGHPVKPRRGGKPIAVFTGDLHGIGHRSHPFPKTGSICRSICRNVPIGISPRCIGTVVNAVTPSTVACQR
ncbi:hypothetical protein QR98_0043870 [Sarcoptes scabiei]|uniref:Uncharacterized protein n=1 Tax=Sarcoptes scabiei TaxID=52283 RepID=A0A132A5M1_SARSC|nr:hypothetical protein QR98_0043870 [Sarcoptes scabiei]